MAKEIYGYINQEYVNAIGNAHYTFNAVNFSSEDLNRCKKIAHSLYLDSLEAKDVSYYHNCSHGKVYSKAIDNLYTFGNVKIVRNASSILNNVSKQITTEENPSLFTVFSDMGTDINSKVVKVPKILHVPNKVCDYSSFFLDHELAHCLKDLNYEENKYVKTLEEVIPIVVELITAYENYDIRLFKFVCASRMDMLYSNAHRFLNSYNEIKSGNLDDNEKRLYRFALEEDACYLNSFYYAMGIFNAYLYNNELVFSLVGQVLNGDITTNDLITILSIEPTNDYNNGFNTIKKYCK